VTASTSDWSVPEGDLAVAAIGVDEGVERTDAIREQVDGQLALGLEGQVPVGDAAALVDPELDQVAGAVGPEQLGELGEAGSGLHQQEALLVARGGPVDAAVAGDEEVDAVDPQVVVVEPLQVPGRAGACAGRVVARHRLSCRSLPYTARKGASARMVFDR
jgi:hypothetical protein